MRFGLFTLAVALVGLLAGDASADCRHAGASFNVGGYYARSSAVVVVRSAPVYAAPAYDVCPAPVVEVPPLAVPSYGVGALAVPSYGYAGSAFAFRANSYDYGVSRRVIVERRVVVDRGVGRRAGGGNAGTGVVGIARAVLGTAGNVVRAVVGR